MIYLSDVLHLPGPDANHPQWDTMLVLRNTSLVPVTARIRLYNEDDGSPVLWPNAGPFCDVILQPNLMWAASFIPGNGFPAPPQNFRGHGTIECTSNGPFGSMDRTNEVLPFALGAFNAWKYGAGLPATNGPKLALGSQQLWRFPYAIPHFDDRAGATAALWTTGMSIQNFNPSPVTLHLRYTIAQTYAEAGQSYSVSFPVPGNGGVRFDMLNGNPAQNVPGLLSAGYPAGLNAEGHVDLIGDTSALLYPSIIVASSDYSFMVKEECA